MAFYQISQISEEKVIEFTNEKNSEYDILEEIQNSILLIIQNDIENLENVIISEKQSLDANESDIHEYLVNLAWNDYIANNKITVKDGTLTYVSSSFSGILEIPSSITIVSNRAFNYCSKLTTVYFPNSITSIGTHLFDYCKSLKKIVLDHVLNISQCAFQDCTSLEEIDTCDYGLCPSYMICKGCTSLKTIKIANDTLIGAYAFEGCTSLTSVEIQSNTVSIGNGAFKNCTSLDITIPDTVSIINTDAFLNVPHITYHGSASGAPWGALSMN